MREKLFSITAEDCEFKPLKGSGAGGQKRNKTESGMRCTHIKSGAVAECEEHREQSRNKREAFRKMSETPEFKKWLDLEIKRKSGELAIIEQEVEQSLRKTKIEVKDENGRWIDEPKT
jgi:protein subunit release factor B